MQFLAFNPCCGTGLIHVLYIIGKSVKLAIQCCLFEVNPSNSSHEIDQNVLGVQYSY